MAGAPQGGIPNVNQAAAQGVYGAGLGSVAGMGYTPQQVQAGQLATTDLSPYMNPYTEQVIKANEADILRGAQMGLNNLGAQAQAARAFGGSRHGVAEAELGRNVASQLAQSSAGLRQAGYGQAQQAALSDIANQMAAQQYNVGSGLQGAQQRLAAANQLANISNLGFGMGQTVQQNLMQQGALQQGVQQALIDAAKAQYGGYTAGPATSINYLSNALQATPMPTTQTQTGSPGLFNILSTLAGIGAQAGMFSDVRLKKDIKQIGKLPNGMNLYKWAWNKLGKAIGADKFPAIGVLAQEVQKTNPEFVVKGDDGYLRVNYSKIYSVG
jgi:hypothetical protein